MDQSITISEIVSIIALALSGYAIWTTSRFNKRQISLIDSQDQLNKRLLEQGEKETLDAQKADMGASFLKLGSSKYRLKVFNKGQAAARNVRISFENEDNPVGKNEIERKFPMEILEKHQSVELIAAVHMRTAAKHTMKIYWEDDHSKNNEKTVYPTL